MAITGLNKRSDNVLREELNKQRSVKDQACFSLRRYKPCQVQRVFLNPESSQDTPKAVAIYKQCEYGQSVVYDGLWWGLVVCLTLILAVGLQISYFKRLRLVF